MDESEELRDSDGGCQANANEKVESHEPGPSSEPAEEQYPDVGSDEKG